MTLTDEKVKSMLEVVNNKFPDWTGFDDPRFIEEETGYKREASKKAKEMLDKDILQNLLSEGKYDDIIKRIEKVGQSTNLLDLSTPKSGDMGILYQENLNKTEFCEVFFNLLYGEDELKKRFTNFIEYIKDNNLPNRFTFPTYFLFLLFPESEIFIEPTIINKYGKFLDEKNSEFNKPYYPSYEVVKKSLTILKEKLSKYNPKDMIDIQSFIWVAVKSGPHYQNKIEKLEEYLREFEKNSDRYLKDVDYARENYNFFQNFIKKENLEKAEWKDFQEMGNYIHSFKTMAIAKANALGKPNHPIDHYRNSFLYLIYGEDPKEQRIRNFCENEDYILKYFGNSAIGEIVGNALADDFIFMNRRDEFALKYLGLSPDYDRGDKFIDKFLKFNEAAKPIVKKYEEIVGRKTDLPINLEVDQFFSYLYETYKNDEENDIKKQYWLFNPGDNWDYFKENSIISLYQIDFGDLSDELFKKKKEIKDQIMSLNPAREREPNLIALAFHNFVRKMNIGDYVFVLKSVGIKPQGRIILGLGQITSDYIYKSEEINFIHFRKIKWEKIGLWEDFEGSYIQKTLTHMDVNDKKWSWNKTKQRLLGLLDVNSDPPIIKTEKTLKPKESYTKDIALSELFIDETELNTIIQTLKYKKNIVLQGAPGVGKTFIAKRIAYAMIGEIDKSRVEMIQFHQTYSYEDFIQGYRPTDNGGFEIKSGVFYEFCKKAQRNPDKDYFFIIDEINRGNLSKIFGELMMLIEKDKRGKEFAIPLTYSKNDDERFYLPENLYFIGTMNTADRSLAMVDYALRRRFGFITLEPAFGKPKFKKFLKQCEVRDDLIDFIIERMNSLNENISKDNKNLGDGYRIGHSYFCPVTENKNDIEWYKGVVKNEIEPLLKEYWFDNKELVESEIKKLMDI